MSNETDSKFWLCKQHEETTGHLITGWSISAKNEYSMRHYRVGAHLHYSVRKTLGTETAHTHTHTHNQVSMWKWRCNSVMEHGVDTDTAEKLRPNRPNIIIKKTEKRKHVYW